MSTVINFDGFFNWDDIVIGGINNKIKCVSNFLKGEDNIKLEKLFDLPFNVETDVIIMEQEPDNSEDDRKYINELPDSLDQNNEEVFLISKNNIKYKINKNLLTTNIILFNQMCSGENIDFAEIEFNIDDKYLSFIIDVLNYYSNKKFPTLKDMPVDDKLEAEILTNYLSKNSADTFIVDKLLKYDLNDMLTLTNFLNYLGYIKLFEICCAKLASLITNKSCEELWDMINPIKHRFEKFPTTKQQMIDLDNKGTEYFEDILDERLTIGIKLYEEKYNPTNNLNV